MNDIFMLNRYLLIISFLHFFTNVCSEKLFFEHLTMDDGLVTNAIKSTYIDSYGYVWIGTFGGVNRFDGYEVKDFSSYFNNAHKSITCFSEDENKVLWIGTEEGLYYWNRIASQFSRLSIPDQPQINITEIQYYKEGFLYFTSDVGFYAVNTHTLAVTPILFHPEPYHLLNFVTGLVVDDDQVYLSTKGGFVQYDISLDRILIYHDAEFAQSYNCVAKMNDRIYLGKGDGVNFFSLSSQQFGVLNELDHVLVLSLLSANDKLFIGTDSDGLMVYDSKVNELQVFEQKEHISSSISSNTITTMEVDDKGVLWIGTYMGGVNYTLLSERIFNANNTINDKLINKSVRSIYLAENDEVFLGTRNGLYVVSPNEELTFFEQDHTTLNSKIILKFLRYKDEILLGTYEGGISSYSLQTKKLSLWQDHLFHKQTVYALDQDSLGNLWIGGFNGVQMYSAEGELNSFTMVNSVFNDDLVFDIKVDRYNRIWVGGDNGVHVYEYKENKLKLVCKLDFGKDVRVVCLYLDSHGTMWVGTLKSGVFVFDKDFNRLNHISTGNGLCNDAIASIVEAGVDSYWISTLKGLSLYHHKQDSCNNFYTSAGLPGTIYCRGASVKDKDGDVWLGNEEGLVIIDANKTIPRKELDSILITEIMVEGKILNEELAGIVHRPVEDLTSLILPGDYNSVGFRFVNVNNKFEHHQNYVVKLVGKDDDWVQVNNKNTVSYNALNPGSYIFNVAISNESGVIVGSVLRLPILIKHQWHSSIFALVLVFIVLLMLVFNLGFIIMGYRKKLAHMISDKNNDLRRYESSHLTTKDSKALLKRIQEYLEESRVYINSDLKIIHISKALDVSLHDISQSINQNLNQGFTDFINTYRIEEYKRCLQKPEYEKFTLLTIAEKCGFNSKSSFNRAFKKVTGLTPSEYASSIQKPQ
ncbi:ligand-binding sensor domain-containing protein [Saccharicrinis fermentans]|nr:two-component regulator propeller domain-containing protein [Saccharicrinis fermentans]